MSTNKTITAYAPAKINLFLRVLDKRPDEYHNIQSIFHSISLYDELEFTLKPAGIDVRCNRDDIAAPNNLVYKAARLLQENYNQTQGIDICVNKHIPIGAGLGGGSSDAAVTLMTLNQMWNLKLSVEQLLPLAAKLGADVPFFLYQGAALVEGTGEKITPWPYLACWVLLVKPDIFISTAWAYRNLDSGHKWGLTREENYINILQHFWTSGSLGAIATGLLNDFEQLVIRKYPLIQEIKEELLAAGAEGALMSGSGSTVFGLYAHESTARDALTRLKKTIDGGGEVYLAITTKQKMSSC
ncbi:MAG: 4-(cytidine 5'-diphospho)-2-C-methyl-D-erythritol kinase [Candidatus Schekmanbacteria bacterium]|nr:4-(cytidine 5'-diphospho)-2-C-methyl-D-erythritol kinase [Candidatus Schekmanbacteria bacterium]